MVGVGVGDSVGWPKARPALAAATTVPVPTSYMDKNCMSATVRNSGTNNHLTSARHTPYEQRVFVPPRQAFWVLGFGYRIYMSMPPRQRQETELHTGNAGTYTWYRLHLELLQDYLDESQPQ